ncbi:MAG TPA: (d)CMP kinase [Tissierellales bacterium]|nr:(d)CMP kinase [Tissierellales bacterium]
MKNKFSIAIDGPAASGKSTMAKIISKKLGLEYIDTGAMYRALTLKVISENIDFSNIPSIVSLLENTKIDFSNNHIYLDNEKVDKQIRKNIINQNVSNISKIKQVRSIMVKKQQDIAKEKNVIMDGRDIGTIVLPNAEYKFFVLASIEERAKRRHLELIKKGEKSVSFEQVKEEIAIRDKIDSNREVGPLLKSPDAYEIDTTNKTIDESVKKILNIIEGDN